MFEKFVLNLKCICYFVMLGTFPEVFSQLWHFPKVQFPKLQLPKSVLVAARSPYLVLAASLSPLAYPSHSAWPPLVACSTSVGLT